MHERQSALGRQCACSRAHTPGRVQTTHLSRHTCRCCWLTPPGYLGRHGRSFGRSCANTRRWCVGIEGSCRLLGCPAYRLRPSLRERMFAPNCHIPYSAPAILTITNRNMTSLHRSVSSASRRSGRNFSRPRQCRLIFVHSAWRMWPKPAHGIRRALYSALYSLA